MSMNLALSKGNVLDTETLYQTPTSVTYDVIRAADPLRAYVDWVIASNSVAFQTHYYGPKKVILGEHIATVRAKVADGWKFEMV